MAVIDSVVPGGAELSLAALAPSLSPLGVELGVVYFHERPGLQEELTAAGVPLFAIGGTSRRGWLSGTVDAIRAWKPDLVHTTLYEADVLGRVAARVARRPVVTSLVNDSYGPGHLGRGARRWKVRAAQAADLVSARLAARFHAVTESVADAMAGRLRIPRRRIDVVYRGRDPEALGGRTPERAARVRAALGIGDDPLVVAAGRLEVQKAFDVLVAAFPAVAAARPGATLVIAGRDGAAAAALRNQVAGLGLGDRVRLLGHRDDLADLIAAADAFVLPSRWEGTAGVLIEAMALETPIVASDLAGVREVVGEWAELVPAGDTEPLTHALTATLDPAADRVAARADATAGARDRFLAQFTIERSAAGMRAFYDRALQGPD